MNSGFIDENYKIEYRKLDKAEIEDLCVGDEFFSINNDDEYYIFIKKEIYTEENVDKIMPLIAEVNKELFLRIRKDNKK